MLQSPSEPLQALAQLHSRHTVRNAASISNLSFSAPLGGRCYTYAGRESVCRGLTKAHSLSA